MSTVLIIIQLLIAIGLVVVILMQKSEGGALGIGGGSGGGLFSPRGAGDVLTRATAILAVAFFVTSMALTLLALHGRPQTSILDTAPAKPVTVPVTKAPGQAPGQTKPLLPAVPGVPTQSQTPSTPPK